MRVLIAALFLAVYTAVLLLTLTCTVSCSTATVRQYNSNDKQDPACYAKYGGITGYCDAIEDEE